MIVPDGAMPVIINTAPDEFHQSQRFNCFNNRLYKYLTHIFLYTGNVYLSIQGRA